MGDAASSLAADEVAAAMDDEGVCSVREAVRGVAEVIRGVGEGGGGADEGGHGASDGVHDVAKFGCEGGLGMDGSVERSLVRDRRPFRGRVFRREVGRERIGVSEGEAEEVLLTRYGGPMENLP